MPVCEKVEYRLIGTAAALLHGVSLPAGDVDILLKIREGVDAFHSALSSFECLHEPALLHGGLQYFCRHLVRGVEVELSTVEATYWSGYQEPSGFGPWAYYQPIACGRYNVPTVALELRLLTELDRNRPDRYVPIADFMRSHGCDLEFIQRGLSERGFVQPAHKAVLDSLREAPLKMVKDRRNGEP